MSTAKNHIQISNWLEEVYKQLVCKGIDNTPNLFSLANISSVIINTVTEKEKHLTLEKLTEYSKKVSLDKVNKHLDEVKAAYSSLGLFVIDLKAKLTYRTVVGASSSFGQPAFEIGLSFDPILNVPYIPGSTIKGTVKSATSVLKEGINDELMKDLFGDDSVGRLDFADAYPVEGGVNGYILIPDVLTPHYSKGGEDILKEDQVTPTPIPFLSIAPKTKFRFLIADRMQKDDQSFLKTLLKAVVVAFSLGIGAKTSLGYGTLDLECIYVKRGKQDV